MVKNILKKANEIINERSEEKTRQYGPMSESIERAARIASDILGKPVDAHVVFAVMVGLKFSRHATSYKQDNFLDAVAYIGAWDNYIQEKNNAQKDIQSSQR